MLTSFFRGGRECLPDILVRFRGMLAVLGHRTHALALLGICPDDARSAEAPRQFGLTRWAAGTAAGGLSPLPVTHS
ncbi:hypothetical protein GCM10022223_66780 [Kineosporia mesophila]|uniref:Uncharacterized protein n=1 Tax=Kineosporia mesophila TaxID=566012 RepID=A0ABP7AS41_9ACTN